MSYATAELEQLRFHLPGLLKLLGENLYSNRRVAYRELVQNAHDSCVRRRLEQPERDYQPLIHVRVEARDRRRWVVIADNGSGLDRHEIREFLATIGKGQTAEVRAALAPGEVGADTLVGEFGVGLLSAFLVGDRVVLRTRRHDLPSEQGLRWICDGQQTYRVETARVEHIGTRVEVRLRPDCEELGHAQVVRESLAFYAGHLGIPIVFGDETEPLNEPLPWDEAASPEAVTELATRWSHGIPPVATLQLQPFTDPARGRVALGGLLCIPQRSEMSVREYGRVGVLIRRMLVTPAEPNLLPRWARFVTGLVDCPLLRPTASREQVVKDDAFFLVQEAISAQLLSFLRGLRRDRPSVWARVVDAHEVMLKRWGIESPELFEAIADQVTFRTSRGQLTLPEYLRLTDGRHLYYFATEQQARTMSLLLESARHPVIDAQWSVDEPFLRVYAELRGLQLVRELETAGGLLEPVASPSPGQRTLVERFERAAARVEPGRSGGEGAAHPADAGLEVVLSSFAPEYLPALVITPRRLMLQREAREALADDRVPAAIAGLFRRYSQRAAAGESRRRLHLNVRNPLVRALAARADEPASGQAAAVLLQLAMLLSGERLSPVELATCVASASEALGDLLGLDVDPHDREAPAALTPEWIRRHAGLAAEVAEALVSRVSTFATMARADAVELGAEVGIAPAIVAALQELARRELES